MEFMKGVKLEKVMKDLEGFDYEVKMFVYHKLNGRDEEAQSYLNAYVSEANEVLQELKSVGNEAFENIPEPKITIPNEEECIKADEEDKRQDAIVINRNERIKFNLHNFFE